MRACVRACVFSVLLQSAIRQWLTSRQCAILPLAALLDSSFFLRLCLGVSRSVSVPFRSFWYGWEARQAFLPCVFCFVCRNRLVALKICVRRGCVRGPVVCRDSVPPLTPDDGLFPGFVPPSRGALWPAVLVRRLLGCLLGCLPSRLFPPPSSYPLRLVVLLPCPPLFLLRKRRVNRRGGLPLTRTWRHKWLVLRVVVELVSGPPPRLASIVGTKSGLADRNVHSWPPSSSRHAVRGRR